MRRVLSHVEDLHELSLFVLAHFLDEHDASIDGPVPVLSILKVIDLTKLGPGLCEPAREHLELGHVCNLALDSHAEVILMRASIVLVDQLPLL